MKFEKTECWGFEHAIISELFKTKYYHTHYEEYDYERSGK